MVFQEKFPSRGSGEIIVAPRRKAGVGILTSVSSPGRGGIFFWRQFYVAPAGAWKFCLFRYPALPHGATIISPLLRLKKRPKPLNSSDSCSHSYSYSYSCSDKYFYGITPFSRCTVQKVESVRVASRPVRDWMKIAQEFIPGKANYI